jgi:Icc protein
MPFTFIQITDHHLRESEAALLHGYAPAYALRAVLDHIARHDAGQAAFLLSTGDLVETPTAACYQTFQTVCHLQPTPAPPPGPLRVTLAGGQAYPLYVLPGNHDDRAQFYRSLFPAAPPAARLHAMFAHQGVQFVCLDWGPGAQAVADPSLLAFLAAALRDDRPTVLLMHHHLVPLGSRWLDGLLAANRDRFWATVRGRNVLGILCGHAHATYETMVEGVPVLGLRSTAPQFVLQDEPLLCLQPLHYRVVTVHPDHLTSRIVEVPL